MSNLLQQFLLHRHLLLNNIFSFLVPFFRPLIRSRPHKPPPSLYYTRDRRTDDVRKFDCRPPRCGKHIIIIYTQYIIIIYCIIHIIIIAQRRRSGPFSRRRVIKNLSMGRRRCVLQKHCV